ncbi:MAG: Smr/MutS family protein [Bacilli bacterium]|nr:Smr/MutS family protein [Bacilli bacterium]
MIQLYSNLPTLDLHGVDREYARIQINDFIRDNYLAKNKKIVIIHGNGTGVIKRTTREVLKINRYVEEFHIDNFNDGMTIVTIRKKP